MASTTRQLLVSLLGISIPIFFLALILKYIFAVRARLVADASAQMSVLIDIPHPTNFYILDAIIAGNLAAFWDVDQAPDPARDRARLDPARDHHAHHARLRARRPERGLRPHGAREGPARRATSTGGTCFATRMLPVSTIIGLQVGLLLSGAMLTETVFAYPGIGSWLRQAIFNRDYPVIQGGILFVAIVFVLREPARRHLVRDHQPADPARGK